MRVLFFLLLILISPACLYAQKKGQSSQLPSQLKKVLVEAPNGFKGLKGKEIKGQTGDVVYASNLTLQGTTENQIMDFDTGGSYMAKLESATSVSKAQELVDAWREKLVAIVGRAYQVATDNQSNKELIQKGYLLTSEEVSISIYSIKYKGEKSFNTFLLIMRL